MVPLPFLALVSACAVDEDPRPDRPEWSFVAPVEPTAPMFDASAVGAALDRSLPGLTAVDPAALQPTLDTLAENRGGCGTAACRPSGSRCGPSWAGTVGECRRCRLRTSLRRFS